MTTTAVSLSDKRVSMRWIPKDSQKIEHRLGVCYVASHINGPQNEPWKQHPVFTVIAYRGNAGKSSFYESYRTAEQRDKRVQQFFADLEAHEQLKAETRARRFAPHTLQVGDILHNSWGWEQTQCDYYQVVSVTPHSAMIQAISAEGVPESTYRHGMADMRVPAKDSFCGEPFRVMVSGDNYIAMKHGSCSKWDGRPKYCSWYA